MNAVARGFSSFFVWWFGELAACVPGRLRAYFRRRTAVLALALGDDDVALTLYRGGDVRELGRIRLDPGPDRTHEVAELLRGVSLRDLDIVMSLPAGRVLRRDVSLPLAAQENLREVLAFEMDRHTPFKSDEVAFDYKVSGVDPENRRLNVGLAVVPRDLLEDARGVADSFGLELDRICVAGEEAQGERGMNLLPHDSANDSASSQNHLLIAVTVLAMILAGVATYLPLHMKQRTLAAYEAQLSESRAAALEVEELKERLADRSKQGSFLIDRRQAAPATTALLAEITERLPDDTWLVQLSRRESGLSLAGFSPAAATLISRLEESPLLSGVRFRSPVTADPRVGKEQFSISTEVSTMPSE